VDVLENHRSVKGMDEKLKNVLEKFKQEHEVYVDAQDLKSYWLVHARLPKRLGGQHSGHAGRKYVSSRNEKGTVLVLTNPEISDGYVLESWGVMETFDEFVNKALTRILEDMDETARGTTGGCETSCG
jgi:hypothetical protein